MSCSSVDSVKFALFNDHDSISPEAMRNLGIYLRSDKFAGVLDAQRDSKKAWSGDFLFQDIGLIEMFVWLDVNVCS